MARLTRNRAKLLSNPQFARLGIDLEEHVEAWIQSSNPMETIGLLDEACTDLLAKTFLSVGGSEGTVWLADSAEKFLVAVYNSGPDSENLVGFEQPIGSGIISLVYAQQQPYCENEIEQSHGHDDTLDRKMHKHTAAMIAVPFYFAFQLRGVVSCVQLEEAMPEDIGSPSAGFESAQVSELVRAVNTVERIINATLLTAALGLDNG